MANIEIAVINESTILTDGQVRSAILALQAQIHRDFAPIFGTDASLSFVPKGSGLPPNSWLLGIFDDSDQAGALGYHDLTAQGFPLAKVFAHSDKKAGFSWTVTASHELLEMLGDPDVDLTAFVQQTETSGIIYAYEVCDAVESDSLGYNIGGVLVSDFVYPAWFESFRKQGSTQFDYARYITSPFQILPGGYIGTFDVTQGSGWQQTMSKTGTEKLRLDSRLERRVKPKDKWLFSKKRM
jgi:hypothetical protein